MRIETFHFFEFFCLFSTKISNGQKFVFAKKKQYFFRKNNFGGENGLVLFGYNSSGEIENAKFVFFKTILACIFLTRLTLYIEKIMSFEKKNILRIQLQNQLQIQQKKQQKNQQEIQQENQQESQQVPRGASNFLSVTHLNIIMISN